MTTKKQTMTNTKDDIFSISPSDALVILSGIKQFGLAADGSDLRDLTIAIDCLSNQLSLAKKVITIMRIKLTKEDEAEANAIAAVHPAAERHAPPGFDPADDMTVEFAIKLSEQDKQIDRLTRQLAEAQRELAEWMRGNRAHVAAENVANERCKEAERQLAEAQAERDEARRNVVFLKRDLDDQKRLLIGAHNRHRSDLADVQRTIQQIDERILKCADDGIISWKVAQEIRSRILAK